MAYQNSKVASYSFIKDYLPVPRAINPTLVLMQNRAKCMITLASSKHNQVLDYGASEFIKEDVAQNLILFGIAGKNGEAIQVTGTDAKRISWSGMFYSSNAVEEKKYLESIINAGNPMTFKAFYNQTNIYNVIIQSASFEIKRDCYITYSINLVEYTAIEYSVIKKDFWTEIPSNIGTDPNSLEENNAQNICKGGIRFNCEFEVGEGNSELRETWLNGQSQGCVDAQEFFCDIALAQKLNKSKIQAVQGIINALCMAFMAYIEFGAYFTKNGKKIRLPQASSCLFSENSNITTDVFLTFLASSCYKLYEWDIYFTGIQSLGKEIQFLDVGTDGKMCISSEMWESLDRIKADVILEVSPYRVRVPQVKSDGTQKELVEVSEECARACLGNDVVDGLVNGGSGSSGGSGGGFDDDKDFVVTRTVTAAGAFAKIDVNIEKFCDGEYSGQIYLLNAAGTPVWQDLSISLTNTNPKQKFVIQETAGGLTLSRGVDYYIYVYIYEAQKITPGSDPLFETKIAVRIES